MEGVVSSVLPVCQEQCWRSELLCGQDLVMAERLLMKHLDAPGRWLAEKHRRTLMNKYCGRYLRDKHLQHYIIYGETVQDRFEHNRRLRNPSTTSVQQALHGLAYCVYGKPDVRRLMFEVFDFEQVQPKAVWGSSPLVPMLELLNADQQDPNGSGTNAVDSWSRPFDRRSFDSEAWSPEPWAGTAD